MKSLIKLAIVILLAHGLVRFSVPYWHHHQFESALKERMLTWRDSSDESITQEVLALARTNAVPIDQDQVVLRRANSQLFLDISYTQPIQFIPTVSRPWTFDLSLSGLVRAAGR